MRGWEEGAWRLGDGLGPGSVPISLGMAKSGGGIGSIEQCVISSLWVVVGSLVWPSKEWHCYD